MFTGPRAAEIPNYPSSPYVGTAQQRAHDAIRSGREHQQRLDRVSEAAFRSALVGFVSWSSLPEIQTTEGLRPASLLCPVRLRLSDMKILRGGSPYPATSRRPPRRAQESISLATRRPAPSRIETTEVLSPAGESAPCGTPFASVLTFLHHFVLQLSLGTRECCCMKRVERCSAALRWPGRIAAACWRRLGDSNNPFSLRLGLFFLVGSSLLGEGLPLPLGSGYNLAAKGSLTLTFGGNHG